MGFWIIPGFAALWGWVSYVCGKNNERDNWRYYSGCRNAHEAGFKLEQLKSRLELLQYDIEQLDNTEDKYSLSEAFKSWGYGDNECSDYEG